MDQERLEGAENLDSGIYKHGTERGERGVTQCTGKVMECVFHQMEVL
jgi:hypothetical protein